MNEEEKKAIKELKEFAYNPNGWFSVGNAKTILNLIEKQQKELDKKDKIIKEIAKELVYYIGTCPADDSGNLEEKCEKCNDTYEKCWIEYFEKKVDKEGR